MNATDALGQERLIAFFYQTAQGLILHDDFTILPHVSHREQESSAGEGVRPVVLYRRQWNTMQIVRLLPADRISLQEIEQMMREETAFLQQMRRENAVQNMYALTFFIFSHWRSDENIREIGQLGFYGGVTKSSGAAAIAIDLARGVIGEPPNGRVAKDIEFASIIEQVQNYPEVEYPEELLRRTPDEWEARLVDLAERRAQEREQAFRSEGKTPGVTAILVLTILVFLLSTAYRDQVLMYGLMVPDLIRSGEWWRLITPIFTHVEIVHLGSNMVALYAFGRVVERIFGLGRFLAIYLLAGLAGSLLGFAFHDTPSLGASGAILGLFGALLAYGQHHRKAFAMTIGTTVYALVIINMILSFVLPNVSYLGHIGGLVGGYLVAQGIGVPGISKGKQQALYGILYVVYACITYYLGVRA